MKLSTKSLKQALADVGKVLKSRTTLPALNCVKLSVTSDDRLQLDCSDCEAWVSRKIECDGTIEPVLVNHKTFSDIIAIGKTETVEIEMRCCKLAITGKGTHTIKTVSADQFPAMPSQTGPQLACSLEDLADGIDAVSWGASTEKNETGYRVCVVIDLEPKMMTCAAISRGGLVVFQRPLINETRQIVLVAAQASLITPELRQKTAKAFVSPNWFMAENEHGSAAIRLPEAKAMEYKSFLELRGTDLGTVFNKHDLLRSCAVAAAMSDADKDCRVRAWREPGSDQVELKATGGGDDGVEMVDAPGEPLHFYLNANYLKAALAHAPTEQVRVVSKDNAMFVLAGDLTACIPQMIDPIKK